MRRAFANAFTRFALGLVCLGVAITITGCGSTGGGVSQQPPPQKTTPSITWPTPAAITYGTALSSTQLDATASVQGTFVYNPAAGTTPAVGTQTLYATFTPTDAIDYASVTANVKLVVNPAVPTLGNVTPRYIVSDSYAYFTNYTVPCAGCASGDIIHDASGLFTPDLVLPSAMSSIGITLQWQPGAGTTPGSYEPWFVTWEAEHPGGPFGNQTSTAFLGSGSQSTLVVSPKTGTLFQIEQASGQIYTLKTDGTTGTFFPGSGGAAETPIDIAVDDVSGNIAYLFAKSNDIAMFSESGTRLCDLQPNMAFISGIAAKGGYMVFTDPADNLVGVAKMDCTGYQTIPVAGQPWAVTMVNTGTELDAYVLSRDKWSPNGLPGLTKIRINPDGTTVVLGSVELAGLIPVSTIRATNVYAGLYQVQAFTMGPAANTAAVLFMPGSSNALVLIVSTDTSNGKAMRITNTIPLADAPIGITVQETASSSTLWLAYILANSAEAVTHISAINPITGNDYVSAGACQTGILAGGFIATSNGVYCAQGAVIEPPLALQP